MTTIRFKHPTDGVYDAGSVHPFDDSIAALYLQRGVAEMPMAAAVRIATELNEAQTMKDVARAADLRDELAHLANHHLSQPQKVQLNKLVAIFHGDAAEGVSGSGHESPVESMESRRADKMMRPEQVKRKA